jgi:hypothetical protein
VVIDVDQEIPIEPVDTGALQVAALHDDRRVEIAADAIGDLDGRHARKRRERPRRGIPVDDRHVLAHGAKGVGHRELRADGIAVGARMR